uniref:Proline rich transmembrane protein 3 n=1 Tax=Aquila chrysaetos chrysaetos TaxID=223781 RepID=A0A663ETQ3_AQUCH
MAAARLVTWGLLLATGVPAGARGTLSAGLSPGGTLQRDRDPLHSPAWGQQRPGPSPAWEASGEPSGAGVPGSERWGGGSLVRWSPPLQAGDATGASLETETTVAGAGTGAWWNGGAAPAVAEEPLVAWQRHEAEGQDSPRGGDLAAPWLCTGDTGPRGAHGHGPGLSGAAPGRAECRRASRHPQPLADRVHHCPDPHAGSGDRDGDSRRPRRGTASAGGIHGGPRHTARSSQQPACPTGHRPPSHEHRASPGSPRQPQLRTASGQTGGPGGDPQPLPGSAQLSLDPGAPCPPAQHPEGPAQPRHCQPWGRSPSHGPRADGAAGTPARPGGCPQHQPRATTCLQHGPPPAQVGAGVVCGTPRQGPSPRGCQCPALPSLAGLLPEDDVGSPQRVRGAVGPVSAPNATEGSPRPTMPEGRSPPPAAPQPPLPRGGRQGGRHSQPPGSHPRRSCSPAAPPPAPGANGTGLRWAELRRRLGFAWEAHVYGVAAVFLLLALGCLAGLAGAAALRPPHLPHVLGAHGLLLAACLLRATFLLLDPYGAWGRLPPRALLLLSTVPFPLLLGAFALLLQRLQRLAQLRLLPARLRGLPALGAAAALRWAAGPGPCCCWGGSGGAGGCCGHPGRDRGVAGGRGCGGGPGRCWRRRWRGCRSAGCSSTALCGCGGSWAPPGRFSRPGWAAQLWLRVGELGTALALLVAAAEPLCCQCRRRSPASHSCWAKALRYFCAGRKAEAPEYPNNCYDWASGGTGGTGGTGPERAPANDISKSLIRNPAEQLPLRALKDSNEAWAAAAGTARMPGLSPKCPNAVAARSCAAFEQGSSPSLGELAFRPPSPIDLRRSIDQALCRRHLLHDGLFGRPRRGSGASLRDSPAPAETPGLGRMARCSSLTDLPGPRQPPGSVTITVTASASSLESSSLKISWNPWRHGLSSPDSLPLDEAPSRAPLLVPAVPPPMGARGPPARPAGRGRWRRRSGSCPPCSRTPPALPCTPAPRRWRTRLRLGGRQGSGRARAARSGQSHPPARGKYVPRHLAPSRQ